MARWFERLDGFLGRLVYRLVGVGCLLVSAVCGYAAWWHFIHRGEISSSVPAVLFGLVALAAASCVPYCFSRNRSFGEALDAMEGGTGDTNRRR